MAMCPFYINMIGEYWWYTSIWPWNLTFQQALNTEFRLGNDTCLQMSSIFLPDFNFLPVIAGCWQCQDWTHPAASLYLQSSLEHNCAGAFKHLPCSEPVEGLRVSSWPGSWKLSRYLYKMMGTRIVLYLNFWSQGPAKIEWRRHDASWSCQRCCLFPASLSLALWVPFLTMVMFQHLRCAGSPSFF